MMAGRAASRPCCGRPGSSGAPTRSSVPSADGWTCGTPIQTVMDGRNALLCGDAMNGAASSPVAHGFPARMMVPGLYGYV